ncbi:hypothetical protein BJX66DRAFT_320524 [Aspergillus keveii]|uniref:Uncharacterized protein n=1 Tax=Aspergillus keveii TaxID=714993 RepID=A0ABR4FH07_9EURO
MKLSFLLSATLAGFTAATPVAIVTITEILNGTTRGILANPSCSTPGTWSCCGLSDGSFGTCQCSPTAHWQYTSVCGTSSSCCTMTGSVPHCIC